LFTVPEWLAVVAVSARVQVAIVLWASGDPFRFDDSFDLAKVDWRDALIRAGLADDDWTVLLDTALGPKVDRA
jgi:hypothetical protein